MSEPKRKGRRGYINDMDFQAASILTSLAHGGVFAANPKGGGDAGRQFNPTQPKNMKFGSDIFPKQKKVEIEREPVFNGVIMDAQVEIVTEPIVPNLAIKANKEDEEQLSEDREPKIIRRKRTKPVEGKQKSNESYWCSDCKIPGFSKFGLKLHRRRVHGEKTHEQPNPVTIQVSSEPVENGPARIKFITTNDGHIDCLMNEVGEPSQPKLNVIVEKTKEGEGNVPIFVNSALFRNFPELPPSRTILKVNKTAPKILPKPRGELYTKPRTEVYADLERHTIIESDRVDQDLPVHKAEGTSKYTKCERCMLPFFTKAGLHHHYRSVHGLTEKPVKNFDWEKHEEIQQKLVIQRLKEPKGSGNAAKPYVCGVCGKSFPWKVSLSVHVKVHTGEKPYKCEVCQRSFSERCHLTDHTRLHTGEKPFHCHICSKAFTWRLSLQAHLKVHTGDKPYSCRFCAKTFAQRTNMLKHLETRHTVKEKRKMFYCQYCSRAYRCIKALKQHLLSHDHPYCISGPDDPVE